MWSYGIIIWILRYTIRVLYIIFISLEKSFKKKKKKKEKSHVYKINSLYLKCHNI